jgi:membrane fusion protein (multidrug efflux system)
MKLRTQSGINITYGFEDLRLVAGLLVCLAATTILSCKQEAASTSAPPGPDVEVAEVVQKDVPIYKEWVGTTDGLVNASIRAQVTGYLLKRNYEEGAFVKKGVLLFEIDSRKFRAAFDQAKGDVDKAQAQLVKNELDVKRDTPLAKEGAISQKELQDDVQTYAMSRAAVETANAALDQAKLSLEWTRIHAPIDGVVGVAKAQIGDLIGPETGELTSISTLDPIRVYISLSEQEYLGAAERIRDRYKEQQDQNEYHGPLLDLILSGDNVYPHQGKFFLADRQVDVKTGTIRLGALFPNPGNILRPGQFGRVRAIIRTKPGALLVPQRAVTELQGSYQVAVVSADNKVEIRPVKVSERVGTLWVIDQGLQPGERVVVEGLQKLKAGMTVTPKPFSTDAADKKI